MRFFAAPLAPASSGTKHCGSEPSHHQHHHALRTNPVSRTIWCSNGFSASSAAELHDGRPSSNHEQLFVTGLGWLGRHLSDDFSSADVEKSCGGGRNGNNHSALRWAYCMKTELNGRVGPNYREAYADCDLTRNNMSLSYYAAIGGLSEIRVSSRTTQVQIRH